MTGLLTRSPAEILAFRWRVPEALVAEGMALELPDTVTGPFGLCAPTVTECKPVSNSHSMTTVATGYELPSREEGEATTVSSDGGGSLGKKPTQGGHDAPKRWNCMVTAGPVESAGSTGHPSKCTPCAFYCFSFIGCRAGRDCAYCHLTHLSKGKQLREQTRAERASAGWTERKRCSQRAKMNEPPMSPPQQPEAVHRDARKPLPEGSREASYVIPEPLPVLPQDSMPPGLPIGNLELLLTLYLTEPAGKLYTFWVSYLVGRMKLSLSFPWFLEK